MSAPVVELRGVSRRYGTDATLLGRLTGRSVVIRAVDGVSLAIQAGEVVGLVGESGCGKSTLARVALLLEPPTEGQVLFDGADPRVGGRATLKLFRRQAQMVFQDPLSSLNRSLSVEAILSSPLDVHRLALGRRARRAKIAELLDLVGLPRDAMGRYPHELSGGQRQRVGIARALAVSPRFLALDEPTSALDVSIQAQIVNLLNELQRRLKLAYLFVSHDLRLVRYLSDRLAVMYLGRIVETGDTRAIWAGPRHPYTRALLDAVGEPDPDAPRPAPLGGDVPSASRPPPGCAFHPRCPMAGPRCAVERPELRDTGGVAVACHLHDGGVR
jgi:oligopeptide/dipeptide ABC transporter ATP-binding protein